MLIVQKYGGTSVGSTDRIRAVAERVVAARRRGDDVVIVVSAMGDMTDELLELAAEVARDGAGGVRHPREMDMLLTAGERISMALLAMAVRDLGEQALSLTGSQAAIITDGAHTHARIREVRGERIREALEGGRVVIVAGFQGVSTGREVTTLGRGGSDTTAVALAAALAADRCEIYSDVRGVYTADPRRVPTARIIPALSYDEMLELATAGAQVMHPRAVEIAARYGVDLCLGSAFEEGDGAIGTYITRTPRRMEELVLTGIAARPAQARLTLHGVTAGLRTVTTILVALAEAGVSVDMVSEAETANGTIQLQLTLNEGEIAAALRVVERLLPAIGGTSVMVRDGLSRIALVGSGMHQQPGVYARAYRALLEEEIDVFAISTSGISITLLVESEHEEAAVRALHDAFTLEAAAAAAAAGMASPPHALSMNEQDRI